MNADAEKVSPRHRRGHRTDTYSESAEPVRVVLLGGGYVTLHAGAALARALRRPLADGDLEVVVLSADEAHSFHGFTGEVLAGLLPYDRTRTPLAEALPRARIVHGRAIAVDPDARTVSYVPAGLDPGTTVRCRTLRYDELVVGTGGREPAATVPGLAEHGYLLRGPGEIEALAAAVRGVAARANHPSAGRRRPGVVVAGGGLAGVEMAAAVADLCGPRVRVELVHSGAELLPDLRRSQPGLARRAEQELDRLGVRVRLGSKLARVTADAAHLADGTVLEASVVIGAIGQRAVPLPGLQSWSDARGRLVTGPDLSVAPGIWAAGDAARVVHVTTGEPVPANALWAIKAGHRAGANVARVLGGRHPRRFSYRGLGQAASFGFGRSVAELYGVPMTGALAWTMRLTFFLRFMPSRRRALHVVGDFVQVARGRRAAAPTSASAAGHPAHVAA